MTINHQEILRMLESHDPNTELSESVQRRQDQIQYIMEQENPDQTKDLITVAQDFIELAHLDENELRKKYNIAKFEELKQQYLDIRITLINGGIYAELIKYEGKTLPELLESLESLEIKWCKNLATLPAFPSGLKILSIGKCPNLESVPEFPTGLERLRIEDCPNLTQETRDRIKEFNSK